MRILQLVPRGDPTAGGVLAYADALGEALSRHSGLASERIEIEGSAGSQGLPMEALRGYSPGAATCLLHYVNYAYHPRGCPAKLVEELRRWRAEGPERRLVTFFHEVYATGPLWRSSFWLAPTQRRLAATLARASDRVATSLDLYGRMLADFKLREPPVVTPVFSTVGEPEAVPALARREPRMVVFGGRGVRARAYGEGREALATACRALGLAEIVDIGPPLVNSALPADLDGIPVRALGALPAAEVSARLLAARAGFLAYPAAFLAKSTIFAAYCAHGLLPVCAEAPDRQDQARCWTPSQAPPVPELQAVADAARSWYLGHSIAAQAATFRDLLVPAEGRP